MHSIHLRRSFPNLLQEKIAMPTYRYAFFFIAALLAGSTSSATGLVKSDL